MYTSKFSVIYSKDNLQHKDTHLLFWSVPWYYFSYMGLLVFNFNCWIFAKKIDMKNMILTYSKDYIFNEKIDPNLLDFKENGCLSLMHISLWSFLLVSNASIYQSPTKLSCLDLQVMDGISQGRERERVKKRERDRKFISPPPTLL